MRELGLGLVQLLLGLFGCSDVPQRPNEFQLVRLIADSTGRNMDMFD